jgi:hypothetical protein
LFQAPNQGELCTEFLFTSLRRITVTYPTIDDLPEEATCTLLGVCSQLSQSRHPGLARWAASVSDALLVRLVTVTTGVRVGGTTSEPPQPLAKLDAAELEGLYSVLLAGAEASDDESLARWCTRMGRLIVAEVYRREYIQVAIDAKADAIEAEERWLSCQARPVPVLRTVLPSSAAHASPDRGRRHNNYTL